MKKILLFFALLLLFACSSTPKINIIDSMGMTMELNKSADIPYAVVISPHDRYGVSTGGFDKVIRIWDLMEGKQSNLLVGHTGMVRQAEFSPDGKFIVSAGGDEAVRLWDASSGKEIKQFVGHYQRKRFGDFLGVVIHSVAFSPDGSKIATCGNDKMIKVWDVKTGDELLTIDWNSELYGNSSWKHSHPLMLVFSPDGKYIATSEGCEPYESGAYIRLWDASSGRQVKKYNHGYHFPNALVAVDISSDGKYVLGGGYGGIIKVWEIESGKEQKAITAHTGVNGVTSAKFSPDSKYILSGGGDNIVKLWDVSTGKEIRRFTGHAAGPIGGLKVAFSPDGKHALSTGTDASVRFWDVATGEEIAMMVGFDDGEWLVVTREGYYNSSEKGAQYLTVKMVNKDYTVDQFYDVFYRPDIVAAKLRGEHIKDLITITMKDAIKSPPPAVEFTTIPSDTDKSKVKVCYQAKNTGGGIGEVRLFHNGKLIQSDGYYRDMAKSSSEKQQLLAMNSKAIYDNMRSVAIMGKADLSSITSKSKGEVFDDCKEVETVSGENEVSVTAFNSGNTVQSYMKTVKFNSAIKPEDPHLYILSIGIDRYKDSKVNLKYAAKDATDIEQKLLKQSASVYKPQNIYYELLIDDKAGKGNIINKINELSRVIKPNDGFILFVAGHGVLLQNQYYMLTSDYGGMVSDASMISSNEIVEISKKIRSLSQLFIFDTCHAGGVDTIVSGLYDARMSVLAKKMGLHIYASANSIQEAQDGYQGNGLFTYTLLDGLNNKKEADKNNDNKISLVELGGYAKQTTTEISKKIGHSQTPLIINFGKDNPIYNLK
jgi:WD40 repeat protein